MEAVKSLNAHAVIGNPRFHVSIDGIGPLAIFPRRHPRNAVSFFLGAGLLNWRAEEREGERRGEGKEKRREKKTAKGIGSHPRRFSLLSLSLSFPSAKIARDADRWTEI